MEPTFSYRIWGTQRSGSTLLSEALTSTGIAGKPHEIINIAKDNTFCRTYGVDNFEDLKAALWRIGMSANGVMAAKYHHRSDYYQLMLDELVQLKGISAPIDNHELIWSEIFPNAKHIYLTRRNKVRQAVSWWKAIQDETWHLRAGEKRAKGDDFYEGKYVFDALMHLFKELMLKECATQAYFSKHNIVPFTVVYEDFVADYEATIHRIINFLGIPHNGYTVATPKLQRTANAHSELWVDRFRKDLNIKGAWEIL